MFCHGHFSRISKIWFCSKALYSLKFGTQLPDTWLCFVSPPFVVRALLHLSISPEFASFCTLPGMQRFFPQSCSAGLVLPGLTEVSGTKRCRWFSSAALGASFPRWFAPQWFGCQGVASQKSPTKTRDSHQSKPTNLNHQSKPATEDEQFSGGKTSSFPWSWGLLKFSLQAWGLEGIQRGNHQLRSR